MEAGDGVVDIDSLERRLLPNTVNDGETQSEDETILYAASFEEMEENFLKYQTAHWVVNSLLLILVWGIGLFMLLYLPVRRYVLRKDIRSRKLYITPNSVVYKVTKPVPLPCFGVLKKEKHILLPSIADVVIEQGYLQSLFGVYSVRIENAGVRRPPSDDVQIQGIANPRAFRKAVLMLLSRVRSENYSRQVSTKEDLPNLGTSYSPAASVSSLKPLRPESSNSPGELILQKLEEVGSTVKRVQMLVQDKSVKQLN